ncbi:MAG: NAD-dependent epimerase/dehydratase family protein [Armatimonadetes bacterium]|nr:NAD-dependent epimerase/dehydratase family protein [Armatimonadota bacterium]
MKIIVTGGAGFIGSTVMDHLRAVGYDPVAVDDLRGGRRANLDASYRLYETDIVDGDLAAIFDAERPDVVVHHAAQVSAAISVRDPVLDARVNLIGTLRLLQESVRASVRHFVFASTGGAIYGDTDVVPCDESHPARPISPYATHKLAAEYHLAAFERLFGLRWTALRYANVYGPRQDPHGESGVVAIFAGAMLEGRRPTIFGDGLQGRDYIYVDDVAAANVLALQSEALGKFNIGTGVVTTTREIYDHLRAALGFAGEPNYRPERPSDVRRIALDATRAETALGWRPRIAIDEGLRRTVEWFRERHASAARASS